MKTKEITVAREIKIWVEDTYKVPEKWTEKDVQDAIDNDDLDNYFQERDMYAFISAGDSEVETGNIEISM